MELQKAMKLRTSVRRFKLKEPDWRDIVEAIDSARYIPIAGKNFVLKFLIIKDKEKIQKIADAAQQNFISQANYVVIVYSNPSRLKNAFGKRGEYYSRQQAGASIQNFLLSLEEKGLSTCWIGHFVDDHIKRELGIPASSDLEAVFPIGYALKKEKPRNQIELDRILYFHRHGGRRMKEVKKVDA